MNTGDPTESNIEFIVNGKPVPVSHGSIYNATQKTTGPTFNFNVINDGDGDGNLKSSKPDDKYNLKITPISIPSAPLEFNDYIPLFSGENDNSLREQPGKYKTSNYNGIHISTENIQKNPVNFSHKGLVSEAAAKILKEYYKFTEDPFIEKTKVEQTLIFANQHALKAIDSIQHRFVSPENQSSLYAIFYAHENGQPKPYIRTYEGMLKEEPVVNLIQRTDLDGASLKDRQDSIIRVISDRISSAPFKPSSKTSVYNPAIGRSTAGPLKDSKSIGYHPYGPLYTEQENQNLIFRTKRPDNDTKNTEIEKTMAKQHDYFNRLMQTSTTIEIPFNPQISIGKTINIDRFGKNSNQSAGKEPTINGKHLVIASEIRIKPVGQTPRITMILKLISPSHYTGGSTA